MSVMRLIVLAVLFGVGVYAFIRMERQKGTRFVNTYKVFRSKSALTCLTTCARENPCYGVNFRADSTLCEFVGRSRASLDEESWQTYHFKALTCAAEEPLLDGTNPVPDSYFTASSEFLVEWAAHNARLSTVGPGWLVSNAERATIPPTFYLQVRFHALNTVVRIATTGCYDWVTLYRLAYSEDCVTFSNLLDVAGNNATIPANTAYYTVEWNQLRFPVRALCLRIFPLEWEGVPVLKLEVYGCPSVSTHGRE